jgi:PAS domain S-box-containing protein
VKLNPLNGQVRDVTPGKEWWGIALWVVLLLMLLFFYSRNTVDLSAHHIYLGQLDELAEKEASYTAELLQLNHQRGRNLDQVSNISRELYRRVVAIGTLPTWLNPEDQATLQTMVTQLQAQIKQRIDFGERFSRSRSAYLNSLKYLPLLHHSMVATQQQKQIEEDEESQQLLTSFLRLVDTVETRLIFPDQSDKGILRRLKKFHQELDQYHPDFIPFLNQIRNGTTHLRLIVTYTDEAQYWLQQTLKAATHQTLHRLHQHYSTLYKTFQQRQEQKMKWLEAIAAMMLLGVLFTLERLRRARTALRVWNLRLQSEVEHRTEELKLAQEEADRVVEYAADPLLILDTGQNILRFNQAASALFGKGIHLLHQSATELFYRQQSRYNSPMDKQQQEEFWITNDKGWHIPVLRSTSKLIDPSGVTVGEVWSLKDITLVKQLNTDIQNYQHAIDQLMLLTISDLEGKITYANSLFLERMEYTMEEVIGRDHGLFNSDYHPKEFWLEFWERLSDNQIWNGEICNQTKSGRLIWSNSSISPMFDVEGKKTGYLAVRIDITEQVEFRKEREQQAYEGGIEEISSSILHNIGNTIMGAEYQALEVQKKIHGLLRVTKYLKKLGQSEALPDGEGARLEKLAQSMEQFVEDGEITLQKQVSTFSHIEGIIEAQRKVVQGGVWMSHFELLEAFDDVHQLMQISDNGVGISDENLKKIFNRGVTTKDSGTGQGLHSMALFVQSLKGQVSVASKGVGRGAQFTIELPIDGEAEPS